MVMLLKQFLISISEKQIKSATEVMLWALETSTIFLSSPKPTVKIRMGPMKIGKNDINNELTNVGTKVITVLDSE